MSTRISQHLLNVTSSLPYTHGKFLHHSAIYKSGKPIFTGCNNDRTIYNGKATCFSTHAEMDVLIKLLKGEARTAI